MIRIDYLRQLLHNGKWIHDNKKFDNPDKAVRWLYATDYKFVVEAIVCDDGYELDYINSHYKKH